MPEVTITVVESMCARHAAWDDDAERATRHESVPENTTKETPMTTHPCTTPGHPAEPHHHGFDGVDYKCLNRECPRELFAPAPEPTPALDLIEHVRSTWTPMPEDVDPERLVGMRVAQDNSGKLSSGQVGYWGVRIVGASNADIGHLDIGDWFVHPDDAPRLAGPEWVVGERYEVTLSFDSHETTRQMLYRADGGWAHRDVISYDDSYVTVHSAVRLVPEAGRTDDGRLIGGGESRG